ncbi:MAG: two-component system response regulator OmpR [Magnetococcales bacterium]|nr:two-component system response regulator OmpR [Magnetococcales bacterium]MBF0322453.1 two-component system response regulator OmpR [Magnetococcales bacterium]
MPTILLIDDDPRLQKLLKRYLSEQGLQVLAATTTSEADKILAKQRVDLLILDLMLPGEDGLSYCRRLRGADHPIPIIMLTAKGDEVDRIVGLEMGADDYLPKPFNPRELVARIQAVLRRRPPPVPGAPARDESAIRFGPHILNLTTRRLHVDGTEVTLTTGEFSLLKVFAQHPRQPLSRDKLLDLARGREHEAFDRSIDVQVSRLRRLIEADPATPRFIQTVWGYGYVFIPDANTT